MRVFLLSLLAALSLCSAFDDGTVAMCGGFVKPASKLLQRSGCECLLSDGLSLCSWLMLLFAPSQRILCGNQGETSNI